MRFRWIEAVGVVAVVGVLALVLYSLIERPATITTEPTEQQSILQSPEATPEATSETSPGATPEPSPRRTRSAGPLERELRGAVAIQVVNAGAELGAAGAATEALREASFAPVPPADAVQPVPQTELLFAPGSRPAALAAAQALGLDAASTRAAEETDVNWAELAQPLDVLVMMGPALP
jgi:hypothetical protein